MSLKILAIFVGLMLVGAFGQCAAQPRISAVVNAASGAPAVSPGSLVSIYGSGLADASIVATIVPLAQTLGSTSIEIGGMSAPILFVSATQINAQVPFEAPGSSSPGRTTAASKGAASAQ